MTLMQARGLVGSIAVVLALVVTAGCVGSRNFSPSVSAAPSGQAGAVGSDVGPRIGNQAPDFTLRSIDGSTVRLADLRGKPVLINFWATWCPPCKEEMPAIEKAYQKYRGQGWVFLGIDMKEDTETVRKFVTEGKYSWTFLMDDGKASSAYRVTGVPETYIVDRDGIVRDSRIGPMTYSEFDSKLSRIK